MALMPREARDAFRADLSLVQEAVRAGVDPTYTRKKDNHWDIWVEYCSSISIDPSFDGILDPIPYLQVFAHRYRIGQIAARGNAVKSTPVSDVLRSVGQGFTSVGAPDPRLNSFGKQDFRLGRQIRSYSYSVVGKVIR